MMYPATRRLLTILLFCSVCLFTQAQPFNQTDESPASKTARPYKIITTGKQVTIKSSKAISHVMLWTTGGNRIVEQRDINANTYTFTIPVNQKFFFLMVGLNDGKIYTEKIGTP